MINKLIKLKFNKNTIILFIIIITIFIMIFKPVYVGKINKDDKVEYIYSNYV